MRRILNSGAERTEDADPVQSLCMSAIRRFGRVFPTPVALQPSRAAARSTVEPIDISSPGAPLHPLCQSCQRASSCEVLRDLTSEDGRTDRPPQLQLCPAGHWCSYVAFQMGARTVAKLQVLEPASLGRSRFQSRVDLLSGLVEDIASSPVCMPRPAGPAGGRDPSADLPIPRRSGGLHPQIRNAIRYIEEHLPDPAMNVSTIARYLQLNSTYLSHLFAEHMGMRMSRFISNRRIQLAKRLLATTDWQIKRVAFESGHSNADWFSQVFHAQEGITPGEYRRSVRADIDSAETSPA
jgi:AraC-like DNA-binding protein